MTKLKISKATTRGNQQNHEKTYVVLVALVADCLTLDTWEAFVDFLTRLARSSQNCYIETLCSGQPVNKHPCNKLLYDMMLPEKI
jgi:hypothetical protein